MSKISANWFVGSYLNLQLKIALEISQSKNRQNLKLCNFQVKFSRESYQRFSYIFFLHLLAVLLWAKYEKISNIWREFWGRMGQRNIYHLLFPLRGFGAPKLCTLVVILNICMPTEFWAPTHNFVPCRLVTRWPCDELTGSHYWYSCE